MPGVTVVLIARIPAGGVAEFQAYEGRVLPLLAEHGGRVERRLRSADEQVELHIVAFDSASGLAAYVADPRRDALVPLLARSGAEIEVLEVSDVEAGSGLTRH